MKKKLTKVAFLDRDGVLNSSKINNGYISKIKDFKWIPGAKKAIKYLKNKRFKVIIVTNQSGVARAYFSIKNVYKLNKYIHDQVSRAGIKIDKILFCPYHPKGVIKKYKKKSSWRKPNIGMFKKINKTWRVDKKKSIMIGDRLVDIKFAKKAGIKGFLFKEKNLFHFVSKLKNV